MIRSQPRVLLAAKAALAASIAWLLAPLIPLADAQYSYYAPLGAVISMYPTLVRSVLTGVQALAGLAVGAAVAFGALAIGGPRVLSVALVVVVGVLLAGVRALGAGREWVPITALFVLLVGGIDADKYSVNYLVHMVLGVVVGVVVNLCIAPPLYVGSAEEKVNRLRDLVGDRLRDLARWLREHPEGGGNWSGAIGDLEQTGASVRDAVREADESRRGNPRGRGAVDKVGQNYQRLRALERGLFFLRDLTDVVGGFDPQDEAGSPARDMPDPVRRELASAIESVAGLLESDAGGDTARQSLEDAEAALAALHSAVTDHPSGGDTATMDLVAATVFLRRMVDAARPLV